MLIHAVSEPYWWQGGRCWQLPSQPTGARGAPPSSLAGASAAAEAAPSAATHHCLFCPGEPDACLYIIARLVTLFHTLPCNANAVKT